MGSGSTHLSTKLEPPAFLLAGLSSASGTSQLLLVNFVFMVFFFSLCWVSEDFFVLPSLPGSSPCNCSLFSRFNRVQLCVTLWTAGHQALMSKGFSRQEYWSGLPWLSPGDLPDPGIKPESLMSPALASVFFTSSATWEAQPI